MYKLIPLAFIILSPFAFAENAQKQGHIGLASSATILDYDDNRFENDSFSGLAIYGGSAFNNNFGLRGQLSFQSLNDSDFEVRSRAFELSFMAGTGLETEGFKAYGSLGFFADRWSASFAADDESFNGLMIGGGLGYN